MTTLWYARILSVDRAARQFHIWLCRWYSDIKLPECHSFFVMILYEIFETWGQRFDLEQRGILPCPKTVPEDLARDYNPPKYPARYIEKVEMKRWCGPANQPVSSELEADVIQDLCNQLQAEYVVHVTDVDAYLSCRADPCLIGTLSFASTAYDAPGDQSTIALGEHVNKVLHPRGDFVFKASKAHMIASQLLQTLDQHLEAISTFIEENTVEDIRKLYLAITYSDVTHDNEILDMNLLDLTAMTFFGLRRLVEKISRMCQEESWRIEELNYKMPAVENFKETLQIVVAKVDAIPNDAVVFPEPHPIQWMQQRLQNALEKTENAFIEAMLGFTDST